MANVRSGKHIGAGDADASRRIFPVEIGQELLQYIDEQGNCQDVTGKDITANDFRAWAGTVLRP
jgi:DNA topoisomerase IB